jgi:hypothetical protein
MTLSRFVALQWLSFLAAVGMLLALPLAALCHAKVTIPAIEMYSKP